MRKNPKKKTNMIIQKDFFRFLRLFAADFL